jgi:DNA end-binding protein Ku
MEQSSMRPIWSGTISFVLVNIPVRLYTATEERSINFNLLHKNDLSRIRYARICEIENKEVPYEEVVRGYEYRKGKYVIINDEDLAKADPKRSQSIEIIEFVNINDIDTIYYAHPYYLEPEEGAEKAYALLREALAKANKVAIAKLVLKDKEHLAVLRPDAEIIILQQLRFAHEIRQPKGLRIPKEKTETKELQLALALIEKLAGKFEPDKIKDDYYETMMKIIEQKARGQTITPLTAEPEPTEFADLMAKLKESLEKSSTK